MLRSNVIPFPQHRVRRLPPDPVLMLLYGWQFWFAVGLGAALIMAGARRWMR